MHSSIYQVQFIPQFHYKAVVDFIVLRVVLQHPSNGWSVSGRMIDREKENAKRRIYADPIDKSDGAAATIFDLRIHDPKHFNQLNSILRLLERRLNLHGNGFAKPPEIRRIEVSFDAYPKKWSDRSPAEISEFTVRLTEWIQRPADKRRLYRKEREKNSGNPKRHHIIQLVMDGWMLGMGHRDSDHFQRAYYKNRDEIDKEKNIWRNLPNEEHRARFENNFSGHTLTALSLTTLDELRYFRFENLAAHFSFRTMRDPNLIDPLLARIDSEFSIQQGKLMHKETRNGVRTLRNRHTIAASQLNQRARQALIDLSNRWCSAKSKLLTSIAL